MPSDFPVIPAQAGIHGRRPRLASSRCVSVDSRLGGNDERNRYRGADLLRQWLLFLALFLLLVLIPLPATAQPGSWLNAGSDIPADPAWQAGTFANGLRYAVRRNPLPAGSVSVRLRIDAGALMERPDEKGYAHFLEHMLFRGTATVPDGEGIRIWQRLGASFGSDTNAFTSATQTLYALDLPRNDRASLDTAMGTLAGMIRTATIDPRLVEVERKVVLAERDLRLPPLARKMQAVTKPLFLSGLAAQDMELAGTEETLAAATAPRLRAFYERWYRPERATLVIVGDADPAVLRVLAERWFGDWTGQGPSPAEPETGAPAPPPVTSAVVVDPQSSNTLTLLWAQPHDDRPWTAPRQAAANVRAVAVRILNRRLTRAARGGAPFTSANAATAETRRIMDQVTVTAANRQGQWRQALDRLHAILAQSVASLPSQAEIDREVAGIDDALAGAVGAWPTARSPGLAAGLAGAVDAGMVTTTPDQWQALFASTRQGLTPAAVGAALRALTAGDARALLTAPVPVAGGAAAFAEGLSAAKMATAEARAEPRAVSFADLGKPPVPGVVRSRSDIADLGVTRVLFANGVELLVKPTDYEKDRVLVSVAVGHGLAGLAPDVAPPLWTAPAIVQGGIGPLDIDGVERLLAGRRITVAFGADERSFDYAGATNARDLPDQLRLIATAIAEPRFDADALGRLTAQLGGSYDAIYASPGGVFGAFAGQPLHGGDSRWAYPAKVEIGRMDLDRFRAFWSPLLAAGPRRVVIVGDVEVAAAIRAVAATLGAATTRPVALPDAARLAVRPPQAGTKPVVWAHRGDPRQIMLALVWPTRGALADVPGGRALGVAASILQTRLFDSFRETDGGAYSPAAFSNQSAVFPDYGVFVASSQMRGDRRADFERTARRVIDALVAQGPTDDEVTRAVAPIVSGNERAMRTNGFWAAALERDFDDPRVLGQLRSTVEGYRAIDAGAVRAAARKWLRGPPAAVMVVAGGDAIPRTPVR